ncbi:MAG: AMIN domain-containing protein [Thermodesulfovibrionales bacterium]|nr:AMIN domain-containing protein [Thermodesulfovibrionales bacterium]
MINLKTRGLILSVTFLFLILFIDESFAISKITSIQVNENVVKIDADNKLNYSIDKTDPFNITIDIDNAQLSNPQDKPLTTKGIISELKAVQGRVDNVNKVRILMALNTPAEIDTKNSDKSLYITVAKNETTVKEAYPLSETSKETTQEPTVSKKETVKETSKSQDKSTPLATEVIAVFMDKVQNGAELVIKGNGLMPEPVVYRVDNLITLEFDNLEMKAFLPPSGTMIFPFKSIKVTKYGKTTKFAIDIEKEVVLAYFSKDIDVESYLTVSDDEVVLSLYEKKLQQIKVAVPKTITNVSFKDGDIKTIFIKLAKDAGYDYIISGDITNTLTIEFTNIPIENAFRLLEKEGNVTVTIIEDPVTKRKVARLVPKGMMTTKDDTPVSFSFQDADLSPVLLLLSEISGYNILLHPEIKDIKYRLTTDLKNVSLKKALQRIVEMFALSYILDEEDKIITIAPIETVNKIEKLRQDIRETRAKEYKAESELFEIRNKIAKEKLQALMTEKKITKIIKLQYISAKTAINIINRLNIFPGGIGQEFVPTSYVITDPQNPQSQTTSTPQQTTSTGQQTTTKDIKEAAEIGIAYNPLSNEIILRHVPSVVEEVEEFLKKIDKPFITEQQVLIEARIVEMNSQDSRDLGVQWGVSGWGATRDGGILTFGGSRDARPTQSSSDYATTPYAQIGIGQATQGTLGSANMMPLIINMPAAVGQGAGGSFGIGYINKAASLMLDFRLSALEKAGKSRVISNPRILTLNDSPAIIRHGARIPITTPGSTQGTFTTSYVDAALLLRVRPVISLAKENLIYLSISVNKDEPNYSRKDSLGNPEISARQAYTNVALKDGETIVIGGLLIQKIDEGEDSVPGVSKIPILGNLFKRNYKYNQTEELLIFITPRIIEQIKD